MAMIAAAAPSRRRQVEGQLRSTSTTGTRAMMVPSVHALLLATVLAAATGAARAVTTSGGPDGAFASATVEWLDPVRFNLRNVVLKDTKCDGHSVHFTLRFNRNGADQNGVRKENSSGCGSKVTFSDFFNRRTISPSPWRSTSASTTRGPRRMSAPTPTRSTILISDQPQEFVEQVV